MQKFETIRQPLLWFWITAVRRTRRGKICKIVATLVCSAGARNTLGPKYVPFIHLCMWTILEQWFSYRVSQKLRRIFVIYGWNMIFLYGHILGYLCLFEETIVKKIWSIRTFMYVGQYLKKDLLIGCPKIEQNMCNLRLKNQYFTLSLFRPKWHLFRQFFGTPC